MSNMYSALQAMSEEEFREKLSGVEDGAAMLDEGCLIWKVAHTVDEDAFNAFLNDGEMPPMEHDAEAMEKLLGGGKKLDACKKAAWFICF